MSNRGLGTQTLVAILPLFALTLITETVLGQGPTIEPSGPEAAARGSRLGPIPGEGANPGGIQREQEGPLSGRLGPGVPRVPQAVTTPGGALRPPAGGAIRMPEALPIATPPIYGTLSIPSEAGDDGPPNGLTLSDAIERLVRDNLTLRSQFLEIPQARADVLTASLRANPVFYADSQLIPYGQYNRQRPGGPLQYDVNITLPLDVSFKRLARTEVAERAVRVLEARYQDAVRLSIGNLHSAYVDVLAARQTIWYARASVEGLDRLIDVQRQLKERGASTEADVNRFVIQRDAAQVALQDAGATLQKSQRVLAALLNLPPETAEGLELRGTLRDVAPPPPPLEELQSLALSNRPDIIAARLGVLRAEADVRLAQANRLSDVFLLYQPYTYQNNAPFGLQSTTSWAVGLTVPLPVFNRNQGNIQRAVINVTQSQIDVAALERQALSDVAVALGEYEVTKGAVQRLEADLVPTARKVRDDTYRLFRGGEVDVIVYLNAQRDYNEVVRQYRDYLARHRRGMLDLNTAVGLRLLP